MKIHVRIAGIHNYRLQEVADAHTQCHLCADDVGLCVGTSSETVETVVSCEVFGVKHGETDILLSLYDIYIRFKHVQPKMRSLMSPAKGTGGGPAVDPSY